MKIKNNFNIEVFCIFFITLIPFLFFIGFKNGAIAQGDPSNYQLFSNFYFEKYISTWSFDNFGSSNFRYVLIPFYIFSKFLSTFINDYVLLNKILLYLFQYFLPAISINFFLYKILRFNFIFRIPSVLFYIYSVNVSIYFFMDIYNPSFIFFPISFTFFYLSLDKFNLLFKKRIAYILLSSLCFSLSQSSVGHLSFFGIYFLSFFLTTIFMVFIKSKKIVKKKFYFKNITYLIIIFFITSIILNSNWFSIDLSNYLNVLNQYQDSGTFSIMPSANLYDALRLLSFWGWRATGGFKEDGTPFLYYPQSVYYDSPIIIFINLIILILCFSIYFYKSKSYLSIFLLIYFFFLTFLLTGDKFPGSLVNFYLEENIFFSLFRDRSKFSLDLTFIYTIMISIGFFKIYKFQKNNRKFIFFIIYTILIIYLLPGIMSFQINHKTHSPFKGWFYKVPDYYFEFKEYVDSNLDDYNNILLLPVHGYGIPHLWEKGSGMVNYVPYSIITDKIVTTVSNMVGTKTYNSLFEEDFSLKFEKLNKFGISHILIIRDKDCLEACLNDVSHNYEFFENIINNDNDITLDKNFGYIDELYFKKIYEKNKDSKYNFDKILNQYALSLYKIPNVKFIESNNNLKIEYKKINKSIIRLDIPNNSKAIKIKLKTNFTNKIVLKGSDYKIDNLNFFEFIDYFYTREKYSMPKKIQKQDFGINFNIENKKYNYYYLVNIYDYMYLYLSLVVIVFYFVIIIYAYVIFNKKN